MLALQGWYLNGGTYFLPGIVRDLAAGVAKYCPKALVAIISNPVNSTVPIAAEVFKRCVVRSFASSELTIAEGGPLHACCSEFQ